MIPFYRPFFDQAELVAALSSGAGRADFENAIAARLGVRHGIAMAYARTGIIATLRALGIQQSEIILPAYTCAVVAEAVITAGNQPVFVDIDLSDYNMDRAAIKKTLTPRTRAIIVTHLFGYPADVDTIRALLGDEKVLVIEDRAQCFLAAYAGTTNLRGDIGLCSLGPNKQLSTIQGGVVITHSAELSEKIRAFRDREMNQHSPRTWVKRWLRFLSSYLFFNRTVYGAVKQLGARRPNGILADAMPETTARDYATAYLDFQARIGLVQLRKLDTIIAKRRLLADVYRRELNHVPGLIPAPVIPNATYAYYTLRLPRRDEINFRMRMRAQGVAVDQTYDYALPKLKPYRQYARGEYPCAEQAAREVVNLPIYPDLSPIDAQHIAECTRRAIGEK